MKKLLIFCLFFFTSTNYGQWDTSLWRGSLKDFENKDYLSAYSKLDQLVQKAPFAPEVFYNRGVVLYRMGDIEQGCLNLRLAKEMKMKKGKISLPTYCEPKELIKSLNAFFYRGIELDSALDYRPRYTLKDTLRGKLRPERTCFDVHLYDLTVRIIPLGKKIRGNNKIHFSVLEPTNKIQLDLFENMKIDSIVWNDQALSYNRLYDAVFVSFPKTLEKDSKQQLTVYYHGSPLKAKRAPWDGGFDWKRERIINHWVGVACEHLGASCWWPNKDHLTDEPDSMLIHLEVPGSYQAISNGTLQNTEKVKGGYTRYNWKIQYPINNYNVTFYMGKYKHFTDTVHAGAEVVNLEYYVLPQHLEKAQEYFKQTKDVVRIFNDLFGTYPFIKEKFCLVESPYAGMEHQSCIAYGNDYGKNNSREYAIGNYDQIIVHEAAHEWWGNSVSCGDMAEAWIHEAFATYSELLFQEKQFGYERGYLPQLKAYREQIVNFWPMVHHFDVNEYSFASNDIYMKGCAVLDNLRCTIDNDSVFFAILKDFHQKYKLQIVRSEDFINLVNEYTHDDYTAFFKKFLYDEKLPVLRYSYKKEGDNIFFTFRWEGIDQGFKMPFGIRLDNRSMRIMATDTDQTLLLENTSTFNFYTEWVGFKGCIKNSYTYFWTRKVE